MGQNQNIGIGETAESPHTRLRIDTAQLPDLLALGLETLQESVFVAPVTDRDLTARDEMVEIGEEGTGPVLGFTIKQLVIELLLQFRGQQNDPQMRFHGDDRLVLTEPTMIQTGSNMPDY